MLDCPTFTSIRKASEEEINYYISKVQAKITSLIGTPVIAEKKTKREKKNEERRYRHHKALYDYLTNKLIGIGRTSGFMPEEVDIFVDMITIEAKDQLTEFRDLSDVQANTIFQLLTKTKKWLTKTDASTPLTAWERSFVDPLRVIFSRDKLGYLTKFALKVRSFSDDAKAQDIKWIRQLSTRDDSIFKKLQEPVNAFFDIKNIGNIIFGGLDEMFLTDNSEVVVTGADEEYYWIRRVIGDDLLSKKEERIFHSELNADESDIKGEINRAATRFYRKMLDGRIRRVRFERIPHDQEEGDFNQAWRKSGVGKFIGRVMSTAKKEADQRKELGQRADKHPEMHTITIGGVELTYVMVKEHEGDKVLAGKPEVYIAHVIKAKGMAGTEEKTIHFYHNGDSQLFKPTRRGGFGLTKGQVYKEMFMEANEHKVFQKTKVIGVAKDGKPILSEGKYFRKYYNFEEKTEYSEIPDSVLEGIDLAIYRTRDLYKEFWYYIQDRIKIANNSIKKAIDRFDMSEEDASILISKALSIGNINQTISQQGGEDNYILGNLTNLKAVGMNYDPTTFYLGQYEKTLDKNILRLEKAIAAEREHLEEYGIDIESAQENELDDNIVGMLNYMRELESDLRILTGTRDTILDRASEGDEDATQRALMTNPAHMRHTTAMMDHMTRRLDMESQRRYFENVTAALAMNEIKADLINVLAESQGNPSLQDYIVNQVKKTFGDPSYEAEFLGMKQGNKELAGIMNKIQGIYNPLMGDRGPYKKWTPEDVQYWAIMQNMVWTSRFLGKYAALQNNWQILNPIILHGFKVLREANKVADDAEWIERVEDTGVLVLLNAFNEIILGGRDRAVSLRDHPYIKTVQAVRALKLNKKDFINETVRNNKPEFKSINRSIRKAAKLEEGTEDLRRLKELSGEYYDLVKGKGLKGKSEKQKLYITEARLRKLNKKMAKKELRRAALFTLSWFPKEGGKGLMTFSGVEKELRKKTAIMSMLVSRKLKLVPGNLTDDEYYSHPAIQQSARFAVYTTQFGMSQVFMANAFGGLGKMGLQFKGYGYNQTMLDTKIINNFLDSQDGQTAMENMELFASRVADAVYAKAKGQIRGKEEQQQDIHLIRLGRWILGRVVASVIGTFFTFNPFMWGIISSARRIAYGGGYGMLTSSYFRGGESPAIGMLMRLAMMPLLLGGDDEDEDRVLRDVYRFVLPPIITVMIEAASKLMDGKLPSKELVGNPL